VGPPKKPGGAPRPGPKPPGKAPPGTAPAAPPAKPAGAVGATGAKTGTGTGAGAAATGAGAKYGRIGDTALPALVAAAVVGGATSTPAGGGAAFTAAAMPAAWPSCAAHEPGRERPAAPAACADAEVGDATGERNCVAPVETVSAGGAAALVVAAAVMVGVGVVAGLGVGTPKGSTSHAAAIAIDEVLVSRLDTDNVELVEGTVHAASSSPKPVQPSTGAALFLAVDAGVVVAAGALCDGSNALINSADEKSAKLGVAGAIVTVGAGVGAVVTVAAGALACCFAAAASNALALGSVSIVRADADDRRPLADGGAPTDVASDGIELAGRAASAESEARPTGMPFSWPELAVRFVVSCALTAAIAAACSSSRSSRRASAASSSSCRRRWTASCRSSS